MDVAGVCCSILASIGRKMHRTFICTDEIEESRAASLDRWWDIFTLLHLKRWRYRWTDTDTDGETERQNMQCTELSPLQMR